LRASAPARAFVLRALRACALLACALLASCSGAGKLSLKGTVLDAPRTAPDFALVDQQGAAFQLADCKGKVVVLTFIYTHCTDTCPYMALKIRQAVFMLGKDADRAVFVAVTTDPERDTREVAAAYSRALGLSTTWHFLTGARADLEKIWSDYGIGVSVESAGSGGAAPAAGPTASPGSAAAAAGSPAQGLSATDLTLAGLIINRFGGGYEVTHAAPFWFIDPAGKMRALLDPAALPADIAANVEILRGRR
jgi:protein SCO1/2